jgi:ABC-2 type transport system permease protein
MRAIRATLRAALAEAWANRAGFWTQVLAMVVNDVAWVVFWVLFFRRVGPLRGWNTHGVLLLWAILTTSGGIVLGLLANARRLGLLAADGGLDAALGLPTPALSHLLVRRIETTNLGDMAFGIVLFIATGHPTPGRFGIYLCGVAVAVMLFTGFLVAVGSLAFFVGRNEGGELGFHALLLLGSYPADIFSGPSKVLLYTLIPAAFVGAVPARLVDRFDPTLALGALAAAAFFLAAGWTMFTLGLRRYTSGSVWTRA